MSDPKAPEFSFQKVCDIAYEHVLDGLTQHGLKGMKESIRLSITVAYDQARKEYKYEQDITKDTK